ncbi:sensor histidine kinase [Roseateles chitinivorans]|uniref:sensor histidine kinase n=1 Tax=Roseateles chitinivorans TaxID=2917965 RepID=UPI003D664A80
MKLKFHLALLSIATVAPLVTFSWMALHDLRQSEQAALHARVFTATRSLANAVQSDVGRAEAALRVLAASSSLASARYEDFRMQALAARVAPENWIVLMDSAGHQLVNTRLSPGEPFPASGAPPNFGELLSATDVTISGLVVGQITKRPQIRLDVPIRLPDGQTLLLTSALSADYFQRLLTDAKLPSEWLVGVFDDKGITVARSHRAQEYVGKPGGKVLLEAARRASEGRLSTVSREGIALHDTFVTIPRLNWVIANGVRASDLESASLKALRTATLGMVIAVFGSFCIALWLGARLSRAFGQTARAAALMGRGELPRFDKSHVEEFDLLQQQLEQVHADLLDERVARQGVEEQRQALLLSEQAARQLAEQQNQSKDEFLAMLGHELRNPLGAIRSAATIANTDRAKPEARSFALGVIARQADHLARIIEDLLEVNRVLRGKITLRLEHLDLAEVVQAVVASTRTAGRFERHEVQVSIAPAFVLGDRTRLEQVVSNLLSNALKFTPEGVLSRWR